MLEINFQYWIDNYDLSDFSNSIANSGDPECAIHTWQNACEAILEGYKSKDTNQQIIISTKTRRQVIAYFREFGAWSIEVLNEMTNIQLSALALQYMSGNHRDDVNPYDSDSDEYESDYFFRYNGDVWTTLSH